MNTTARLISYWDILTKPDAQVQTGQPVWGIVLASILALVTALFLIYVKDLNRHLYSDLEALQQLQEELKIQNDQLLLEQNTWAAQSRVQEIAQAQEMVLPSQSSTIIFKLR
jgi:cell division protein FtsL